MKRFSLFALSFIFVLTSMSTAQAGVIKAGSTCANLNQIANVGKLKFICTKSGNKMVWTQKSTNSSPQQKLPSVESTPVAPSSFADLWENRKGIAYGAFSKVANVLTSKPRQLPTVDVYRGPNTSVYVKDISVPFQFVTRLFPTFELPKKIIVIYWSNQDMAWATNKAKELMGTTEWQNVINTIGGPFVDCYTPTNCNVGHAFISADGTAYIGLGNPDHAEGDSNFVLGQKEEIEFYHSLQLFQYFKHGSQVTSKGTIVSANFPPAWINVAGENFTFDSLRFEGNLNGFIRAQNFTDWMNHIGHPISPEWLSDFLDIKNLGAKWSDDGFATITDSNCIGASIIEILVALKGPNVLLDFHNQMSQGKSFAEVFKNEFGTSWEEASPVISKVIYDKYLNNY